MEVGHITDESVFAPGFANNPCIVEYHGQGKLRLHDGEEIECRFDAVQFGNSDVALLVSSESDRMVGCENNVEAFQGVTTEGFHVSSVGPSGYYPCCRDDLSLDLLHSLWWPFQAQQLRVVLGTGATHSVRFGLTNLMLFGTERTKDRIGEGNRQLQLELAGTNVIVRPVIGYTRTKSRLLARRSTDVTCEAVCETADEQEAKDLMDGLCRVLSVARGTTIQWVYCNHHDREGKPISRTHWSRDKKSYYPFPVIRPDELAGKATKEFVEKGFPAYMARRDVLSATIDLYLDAKAELDCLISRGAKMAVAMESLNAAMLKDPGLAADVTIVSGDEFKKLTPIIKGALKKALKDEGIECGKQSRICEKIPELNRTSFRTLITRLCKHIELTTEQDEIRLFVKCRNSLIHRGDFYCNTASDRDRPLPLPSPAQEYSFLVHFLDRVLLRLLGYNGPYLERCHDSLVRRDCVC